MYMPAITRTTLLLPDALIDEARGLLGYTSKTDTVIFALREVVRQGRLQELKTLMGRVSFEFDPADMRARDRAR
jgi:Arc/MetJ family transcription regulator